MGNIKRRGIVYTRPIDYICKWFVSDDIKIEVEEEIISSYGSRVIYAQDRLDDRNDIVEAVNKFKQYKADGYSLVSLSMTIWSSSSSEKPLNLTNFNLYRALFLKGTDFVVLRKSGSYGWEWE